MTSLFSLKLEKNFLAGLLQNPEIFVEVDRFVTEKTFYSDVHSTIFSCFKSIALEKIIPDKIIIAQKIKNLGISFKDDLDIFDYLEAITFTPITPEVTINAAQELVKLAALRDLEITCDKIKTNLTKKVNEPLSSIITQCDKIYADKVGSLYVKEQEPVSLYDDILEQIELRGNNPIDEIGLKSPFPEFNRLYGGFRGGNFYVIVSRAKSGKTTVLNHLGVEVSKINDVPVLILDTEMNTESIKFRIAANITGVPLWYLETGQWRKKEEYVKKVRTFLMKEKLGKNKVQHFYIANKSMDEVESIIRRWHLNNVPRGKEEGGIIIYDYLKIPEKTSQHNTEWQLMGEKVDRFKKLCEELKVPAISAAQTNRSGIVKGKNSADIIDDESTVSISDRINWFATYVGILRRKTIDEIVLDTPESGTHKLIEAVARYQGKDAAGHQDLILREFPDGTKRYVQNYINLNIENFRVEERGSLKDSIQRQKMVHLAQDHKPEEETLQ